VATSFATESWKSATSGIDEPTRASSGWTPRLIVGGIACCLLLQLHLVFTQPINWDEFRFLADVHAYSRGELSAALLTFQVHLFGWLPSVGDEIAQIHAGRLTMFALEAGTLFFIWTIALRFFEPAAPLFAALAYVSFSFVLQHGASFRFDPIVIFLVLSACALLLRDRLSWIGMALVGLALAAATMVSIKTALLLPLIVGIGLFQLAEAARRREASIRLLGAAMASALFLVVLYAWHVSTLAGASGVETQQNLGESFAKTLREIPFFPRRQYLLRSVTENPVHWLLLLLGISAVMASYRSGRARALVILAFLLPLLGVAFYRNAFPYYYAVMLAPASLLFAAAAGRRELRNIVGPLSVLLTAGAFVHHQQALSESSTDQQRIIDAVHAMFPKPLAYIDRCSMIATFPQIGMFLSTWWMENYIVAGRPVVREMLIRAQPVFVIANSPFLTAALQGRPATEMNGGFLEADRRALQSNFVHHWGPIWVAGKSIDATPTGAEAEFLVGGSYSLESSQPVRFDGRWIAPGQALRIEPGKHRIAAAGAERVVFRWGVHLPRPKTSGPTELTFGRF
jgi:hypothetical protein